MGFDLMGLSPTNQIDFKDPEADFKNMSISGTYFRSNCWCWRPLWEFVINTCADIITPDDADNGHYNQGHEINKVKALNENIIDLLLSSELFSLITTQESCFSDFDN